MRLWFTHKNFWGGGGASHLARSYRQVCCPFVQSFRGQATWRSCRLATRRAVLSILHDRPPPWSTFPSQWARPHGMGQHDRATGLACTTLVLIRLASQKLRRAEASREVRRPAAWKACSQGSRPSRSQGSRPSRSQGSGPSRTAGVRWWARGLLTESDRGPISLK